MEELKEKDIKQKIYNEYIQILLLDLLRANEITQETFDLYSKKYND
jgi:hypothetical protein